MAKSGPGEQTQAELDDGRIQSVSGLLQLDAERFLGIEGLGLLDEHGSEIGENAPVAFFVGLG